MIKHLPVEHLDAHLQRLYKSGYAAHHQATRRGYESVKTYGLEPYCGRYGYGYRVYINNPASSRYVNVLYVVKQAE